MASTTASGNIRTVPLVLQARTHQVSQGTIDLLEEIGGKDRIIAVTSRFYPKMFEDSQIYQFVARTDDPHAERLGTWIAEKMNGDPIWTNSRPSNSRTQAHHDAWHSPKRTPSKHGRRFKLDDCRIWMRLMFWSAREEGLDETPFFEWFVKFIGHFIGVYEATAPAFARESAEWSADPKNIEKYLAAERRMSDVIGLSVRY
eukprot:JP436419.1.p1 GENE.JP436419.1~~JP436419.1.p1  ORF type:complete len:226 (-),score=20.76 JP436419.1:151-753(-)